MFHRKNINLLFKLCIVFCLLLKCIDHLMAGIEDITAQRGHHLLRERYAK